MPNVSSETTILSTSSDPNQPWWNATKHVPVIFLPRHCLSSLLRCSPQAWDSEAVAHGLFWLARGGRLSHWLRGAACDEEALSPSAVLSLGSEDPGNELLVFSWDERCLIFRSKQSFLLLLLIKAGSPTTTSTKEILLFVVIHHAPQSKERKQTDKSSLLSPLEAATLPDWNSLSCAELGTVRMQVTSSVLLILSSLEVGDWFCLPLPGSALVLHLPVLWTCCWGQGTDTEEEGSSHSLVGGNGCSYNCLFVWAWRASSPALGSK